MKLGKILGKNKDLFKDLIFNTLAFGLYIMSMHILLMPYLAKVLDVNLNSQIVLFVMVLNILTSSFGHQLGMVLQLNTLEDRDKPATRNYDWLLRITSLLLIVVSLVILLLYRIPLVTSIILTLVLLIGNDRAYYLAYYRKERKFHKIGLMNGLYFIAILLGILLHRFVDQLALYWIPLLLAELASSIFAFIDLKIYSQWKLPKTEELKLRSNQYINLIISNLIANGTAYGDKLLALPLLGKEMMNIYYSGTVLAKMIYLVINPINGVLLAWMTGKHIEQRQKYINKFVGINIGLMILTFVINIPLTYAAIYFLYPQNGSVLYPAVIPLSISCALGVGNTTLINLFLKFANVSHLKYLNLINLAAFFLLGSLGAKLWGLPGFIGGLILSKVILWVLYVLILKRVR